MDYKEMNNVVGSPPPYSENASKPYYSPNPRPPPPSGYSQTPSHPPVTPYAPAPPVFQQQSTNNVVVVGQPQAPRTSVVHVRHTQANTYMVLTLVLMVLCFFHGNLPAFVCLIPALICASSASDHNNAGEYSAAKDCGTYSLCCNIFSIIYFVLLLIGAIVVVVIYFTVGFNIAINTNCCPSYQRLVPYTGCTCYN